MDYIWIALISVASIGLICGVVLAVASKIMAVKTDKKTEEIRACLPGANCGACGYSGCDGYAKALAQTPGIKTNLCIPGGDTTAKNIADVLGVEKENIVELVAVSHCHGDCACTSTAADYKGIKSCAAAKMFYGGGGKCPYGCIGFGDCASVCPSGAICIHDGIAHFDTRKCTGCGLCVKACPNHIIETLPDVGRVIVTCNSMDKGAAVRRNCIHGCIACKKCERTCAYGAITVQNNLPKINYDLCMNCFSCVEECPTGCLMISDLTGIHKADKKQ